MDAASLSKRSVPAPKGSSGAARILEVLSEPVTVNSTYSNLADELGELVAKHALNLKVDDVSSAAVTSFKSP